MHSTFIVKTFPKHSIGLVVVRPCTKGRSSSAHVKAEVIIMANKGPKTEKGKARRLIGGNGRTKPETAIRKALDKPVTAVDEALGGKRKNGKKINRAPRPSRTRTSSYWFVVTVYFQLTAM